MAGIEQLYGGHSPERTRAGLAARVVVGLGAIVSASVGVVLGGATLVEKVPDDVLFGAGSVGSLVIAGLLGYVAATGQDPLPQEAPELSQAD